MATMRGDPPERFADRGEIARGGMASVRRTFDHETERIVAVKSLDPGASSEARAHFLAEARIMARLDHPSIVPIYDIGRDEHGEPSHLLMKLVEGRTLADAIAATAGEPASSEALEPLLRALLRVCEAIAFAHSRGVIHRDLKPGNVMLGTHGQVYAMDWGLALVREAHDVEPDAAPSDAPSGPLRARSERPDEICGTPAYMAPEQARGGTDEIDERTDVFGLGAILYEILTLRPPFQGASFVATIEASRTCNIVPPDRAAPARSVPAPLAAICMQALSACRDARHGSVERFAREVEDFLRAGGWFPVERFASGSVMIREGDHGDRAYIVTDGRCEVFRELGDRTEVLRDIGAGQVVGEVALFAPGPRIASVRAITDVSAMVVTRATLDRELVRAPWIGSLLREAAERYAEAEGLRDRSTGSAPGSTRRR